MKIHLRPACGKSHLIFSRTIVLFYPEVNNFIAWAFWSKMKLLNDNDNAIERERGEALSLPEINQYILSYTCFCCTYDWRILRWFYLILRMKCLVGFFVLSLKVRIYIRLWLGSLARKNLCLKKNLICKSQNRPPATHYFINSDSDTKLISLLQAVVQHLIEGKGRKFTLSLLRTFIITTILFLLDVENWWQTKLSGNGILARWPHACVEEKTKKSLVAEVTDNKEEKKKKNPEEVMVGVPKKISFFRSWANYKYLLTCSATTVGMLL